MRVTDDNLNLVVVGSSPATLVAFTPSSSHDQSLFMTASAVSVLVLRPPLNNYRPTPGGHPFSIDKQDDPQRNLISASIKRFEINRPKTKIVEKASTKGCNAWVTSIAHRPRISRVCPGMDETYPLTRWHRNASVPHTTAQCIRSKRSLTTRSGKLTTEVGLGAIKTAPRKAKRLHRTA